MKNQSNDGLCYSFSHPANALPFFITVFLLISSLATGPMLFAQNLLLDFQFEQNFNPSTNYLNGSFSINGTLSGPSWVNGTPSHGYLTECNVSESGWAPEYTGWSAGEALVFTFNTLGRSNLRLQLCKRAPNSGVNLFGTLELWGNDGSGFQLLWSEWTVTAGWDASWDLLPMPSNFENKPVVTIELRKKNNPGSQSYGLRIDNFQVYTLNSLPVELVSFKAHHEQRKNVLNWHTASETNNQAFFVERSEDGRHWHSIGTVNGQGNSLVCHDYSFDDQAPLPLSYYRLQQRDFDGQAGFSDVISLDIASQQPAVSFYPNPCNGLLHIQDYTTAPTWVKVYALNGNVLIDQPFESPDLNVSALPSGVYNIAVTVGDSLVYQRFVKL